MLQAALSTKMRALNVFRSQASALTSAILFLAPPIAHSSSVTLAAIKGSWDLRTVCMNDSGKPGACIEMKPSSLQFTFAADGKWASTANDQNKTKNSGTYEVHEKRLLLKVQNGALYQNWQADVTNDGNHLVVNDKKLIETFERLKSAE